MRETIFGALRDSVLLRVGVVSAPLVAAAVVFAIGLPHPCTPGQGTGDCPAAFASSDVLPATNVQTASIEPIMSASEFGPPLEKPVPVAEVSSLPAAAPAPIPAEPDRAALAGEMLAGTFVELQPALAEQAAAAAGGGASTVAMTAPVPAVTPAPAARPPSVAAPRATALATIAAVPPAGTMSYSGQAGSSAPVAVTPPAVAAMARATQVAALSPAGAPAVVTPPADIAPIIPLAPLDREAVATAEPSDSRIVGGQGVNVRAKPSMGGAKLFALASGEKVTVKQNQRGWLNITDDQGRSGWAYSDFLRNP